MSIMLDGADYRPEIKTISELQVQLDAANRRIKELEGRLNIRSNANSNRPDLKWLVVSRASSGEVGRDGGRQNITASLYDRGSS